MTDYENYDFDNCETRINASGPYHLPDVLAAIYVSRSNYAEMARLLGRNRSKVRDYVLRTSEAKLAFDDVREALLDDVESYTFTAAINGDGPSQRFLLQTLGKDRGYSTRQETTGAGGAPLRVINTEMSLQEAEEAYADTL